MNTIKVEICCGDACYRLGGEKMVNLEERLPDECRGRVEIKATDCLKLCERTGLGGPPYVRFNGTEVMSEATPDRVLARIRELTEAIP